jgi:hypothetical protein
MSDPNLDSHALVQALRQEAAEPAARERVRARLAAAGALGATTAAASLAAAQSPAALAKLGVFGAGKLLLVSTGVIALGTAAVLTMSVPAPASRPAPRAQRAVVSSAAVRAAAPEVAPAEPVIEVTAPAPLPASVLKKTPRRVNIVEAPAPAPAPPASTLTDESALLGRAVQALHAGQHEMAKTLLEEHAQRFPDGVLARERQRARLRLPAANEP